MAIDPGNAVAARWVGPAGHQLWDGTILTTGAVIVGIGKDEADESAYWENLGDMDAYSDAPDASLIRVHDSFGVEEGGGSTGRPLTQAQIDEAAAAKKSSRSKPSTPDLVPTPDEGSA